MPLRLTYSSREFHFNFHAKTSRGPLSSRRCWFIELEDLDSPGFIGRGEVAPLHGLSPETPEQVEKELRSLQAWAGNSSSNHDELPEISSSVRFGLEMAKAELKSRTKGVFFDSPFLRGAPLPINGLVWMNDIEGMKMQALEKVQAGHQCIKFKVGGLDFKEEVRLLAWVRDQQWGSGLTIRLDANGAFGPDDVFEKLERFAAFDIHSIEQPVRAGQYDLMKEVCFRSPIPVALDEELINISRRDKEVLIGGLRPDYLVLKPSLHGGLSGTMDWVDIAIRQEIGWWITSSLESPLGLSALAQFTSSLNVALPQGLGTGQIYSDAGENLTYISNGALFLKQFQ